MLSEVVLASVILVLFPNLPVCLGSDRIGVSSFRGDRLVSAIFADEQGRSQFSVAQIFCPRISRVFMDNWTAIEIAVCYFCAEKSSVSSDELHNSFIKLKI
jgi:hypothetical protein